MLREKFSLCVIRGFASTSDPRGRVCCPKEHSFTKNPYLLVIYRYLCAAGEALGIGAKPNFRWAQGKTLPILGGVRQNEAPSDPRGRRVARVSRYFGQDLQVPRLQLEYLMETDPSAAKGATNATPPGGTKLLPPPPPPDVPASVPE